MERQELVSNQNTNRDQAIAAHVKWARYWAYVGVAVFIVANVLLILAWLYLENTTDFSSAYFALVFVVGLYPAAKRFQHLRVAEGLKQRTAEEVLAECKLQHKPYAVYLRNFSEELSTEYLAARGLAKSYDSVAHRAVESLILEAVGKSLPVLGLSNAREPSAMPGIYRFEHVPVDWVPEIGALISGAECVFIYITEFSNGISREIELARKLGITSRTIVIIGRKMAKETSRAASDIRVRLSDFDQLIFEREHKRGTINPDNLRQIRCGVTKIRKATRNM